MNDVSSRTTPIAYTIRFDAHGGTGAMEPMDLTVNKPAVLTACGFTRFDSDFAGWAIEPEGEVLYRDCAEVSNLTLESDAVVTLYAVWKPRTWTEGSLDLLLLVMAMSLG